MKEPTDNKNKIVICENDLGDREERIAYFESGKWNFRDDNQQDLNIVINWQSFDLSLC